MSKAFPHVCPGQDCAVCRWLVWKDQWPRKPWKAKQLKHETRSPDGDGQRLAEAGNICAQSDGTDGSATATVVTQAESEPAESHTKTWPELVAEQMR